MKRFVSACCLLVCGIVVGACGTSSSEEGNPPSGNDGGKDGTAKGADGGAGAGDTGTGAMLPDGSPVVDGGGAKEGSTRLTDGPAADGPSTSLPALHVNGNHIADPTGKTVVLRGVAIPDIGALDVSAGGSTGVANRIDEVLGPAMLDVDVIRMPVYPRTCFNSDYPYYSPEPFPVGTAPAMDAGAIAVSASDYISQVLKPAVDYATSKNLYVIVDYHQIDNVTGAHGSSADAVTFWTQIAPVFSGYPNVLYEAFNEPIDTTDGVTAGTWSTTFTTAAQSWVTAIRGGAPDNIIIVGSPSWSQYPNGSSGLTGGNLAFTAHLYPGNWPGAPTPAFQDRFTAAVALVPVFMTEWGYTTTGSATSNLYTPSDAWATSLQSYANANGASWTAWVADPSWGPPMFANPSATMLTDFGTFVQGWLKSP